MPIDLSRKTCMVHDMGLGLSLAQKLGESFGKVYYCYPMLDPPFPQSLLRDIGKGIPEIEVIRYPNKYKDKTDIHVFTWLYQTDLQEDYRKEGRAVFGPGEKGQRIELDRMWLYEQLEELGFFVPFTYRAEGLTDLKEYLKGKKNKYLKVHGASRGDFESKHYRDVYQIKPFLDDLQRRLGSRDEDTEIYVQNPVEAVIEVGSDLLVVKGEYARNGLTGYEDKDVCFVGKVFPEQPMPLRKVNDNLKPLFKGTQYQGHFSTEVRFMKNGKPCILDLTARPPIPPGALMSELYVEYARDVYDIANGEMPTCKYKDPYGVQLILKSHWHGEGEHGNELCVRFSEDLKKNVKLMNHKQVNKDTYYIIPNDCGDDFGSVVGTGTSLKQAMDRCFDAGKEIQADGLHIGKHVFEDALESVEKGRKYGLFI